MLSVLELDALRAREAERWGARGLVSLYNNSVYQGAQAECVGWCSFETTVFTMERKLRALELGAVRARGAEWGMTVPTMCPAGQRP